MKNMATNSPQMGATPRGRLSALIGGSTIEKFNEEVRERRWAFHSGAFAQADIEDFFYSADQLETDMASNVIEPGMVDVFVDGQLVRLADLHYKSGQSHLAVVVEQIRKGAMVRVRDLQSANLKIEQTLREIERLFLAKCHANLYMAPAGCTGFPAHFDISDVFIIQCSGTKDWTVYEDYVDRVSLPAPDTPWEPERYRPIGPGQALSVRAGDVLYLPRGVMHTAQSRDRYSVHLTISLEPLTYADMLVFEVRRLAHLVPELRARAAWSWGGDDQQLTKILRDQMQVLGALVEAGPPLRVARRALIRNLDVASGTLSCVLTQSQSD